MNKARFTRLFIATVCLCASALFTGCASLLEEDPDSQQLPWASPAQWENTIPGMPNQGF